jgi:hypothetical protein
MSEEQLSLEDQLALTFGSMVETQRTLKEERSAWAEEREKSKKQAEEERAQFLSDLKKERDAFWKEAEKERAELGKLKGELLQSVKEGAQKSTQELVSSVVGSVTKQVAEQNSTVMLQVKTEKMGLVSELKAASREGRETAEKLKEAGESIKLGWKEWLFRMGIMIVPTLAITLVVAYLIGDMIVSSAHAGVYDQVMEHEKWKQKTHEMKVEHDRLQEEVEKWKKAGVEGLELVPCPGGPGYCVEVDPKRPYGKKQNFFVPVLKGGAN